MSGPRDPGGDVGDHPDGEPVGLGCPVLAEQLTRGLVDPVAMYFEDVAIVGGHGETSATTPMCPTASAARSGSRATELLFPAIATGQPNRERWRVPASDAERRETRGTAGPSGSRRWNRRRQHARGSR
ncbi:hypothetical protein [Halorubrum sp. BOL3-1]|uniref:hypothetical protein n=1 Tax=Halorubrum sp. BOL3-1 TaxID=2497325 RepID=UPI00140E6D8B|nr:hypothetical protein [Halorubrum sp. BOL3-1]